MWGKGKKDEYLGDKCEQQREAKFWLSIFPMISDCTDFFLNYSMYVMIYLWLNISICGGVATVILWKSNEQLLSFSIVLFA